MHILTAVEGALVVAALRQPQVLRVEALELRGDLGGLLLVFLLLLPHVVEALHEDGLVEELLPCPVVLEDTLDHPIPTYPKPYSAEYLLFSVSILTFLSVMNSWRVCALFFFTFTFSLPCDLRWKSSVSCFFLE